MAVYVVGEVTRKRIEKRLREVMESMIIYEFNEPDWIMESNIINLMLEERYYKEGRRLPGDLSRQIRDVNCMARVKGSSYRIRSTILG
jgi:hypothetical protein